MANKTNSKPSTSNKKLTIKQRNQKFEKSINTRGMTSTIAKEEEGNRLSPIVIGVLLFVVLGSAVFQLISTAARL